eukprot:jgi/Hompol1/5488/HPOL_001988-RA
MHEDMIHDLQMDYYGKRLATCSSDRSIKIFSVEGDNHTLTATLVGHEGPVWQVAWAHPKFGNILASCSYDSRVFIWREFNGQWTRIKDHTTHTSSVNSIGWAPHEHGLILAAASSDGKVSVLTYQENGTWDVNAFNAHSIGANTISWAPSAVPGSLVQVSGAANATTPKRFASGGCDNLVKIWREDNGAWREEIVLEGHTDWVRDVAWAPSIGLPRNYLATSSQDKTVLIWTQDSPSGPWTKKALKAEAFPDVMWRVSWSLTGNILAVSSGDNTITLWKENVDGSFAQIADVPETTHDSTQPANAEVYEGLGLLQHRGQDAAGIITCGQKGRLYQCKANGMVRDVFTPDHLSRLMGHMGVGHVRYPTAGSSSNAEAQPFYVNSPFGIVLSHNGNLTNADELKEFLDHKAHRHVNTESDSELLLNVLAYHLQQTGTSRTNETDIVTALGKLHTQCRGGYACIAMIAGFGLIGFRDPHGIRPLILGQRRTESNTTDYIMASESVCLEALGYSNFEDIKPGQAVILTSNKMSKFQTVPALEFTPCIFEYVYFARPDSIMDGISVYKARLAMGEALATAVIRKLGKEMDNIDVVIPVPDTSRSSALQVSYKLNKLYREGFIKNRYIGRTFIMPGQQMRVKSVRRKLNPMTMEFAGKNVLLVDDSIVRGTTSREIVQMARDAGANKVYFASCAPAIRYPNVYGIDMPTRSELIAFGRDDDEVAEAIGADCNLDDLVSSVAKFSSEIKTFDVSVFNGKYVTGDITPEYLQKLESQRNESTKSKKVPVSEHVVGLYNHLRPDK